MLEQIVDAIVSSVSPEGASGGILYAALMQHGFTYNMFCDVMALLVQQGRLRKVGEVYYKTAAHV